MAAKENKTTIELATHGVSVQLPQFMKTSPIAWFNVCEANFSVRGVTQSDTKYWHAVSQLDQETLEQIQEFLVGEHGEDPYN